MRRISVLDGGIGTDFCFAISESIDKWQAGFQLATSPCFTTSSFSSSHPCFAGALALWFLCQLLLDFFNRRQAVFQLGRQLLDDLGCPMSDADGLSMPTKLYSANNLPCSWQIAATPCKSASAACTFEAELICDTSCALFRCRHKFATTTGGENSIDSVSAWKSTFIRSPIRTCGDKGAALQNPWFLLAQRHFLVFFMDRPRHRSAPPRFLQCWAD